MLLSQILTSFILGLHHEQNRPDRDNFIYINWNNIERSMQYNFNKQSSSNIDSKGNLTFTLSHFYG